MNSTRQDNALWKHIPIAKTWWAKQGKVGPISCKLMIFSGVQRNCKLAKRVMGDDWVVVTRDSYGVWHPVPIAMLLLTLIQNA